MRAYFAKSPFTSFGNIITYSENEMFDYLTIAFGGFC